MKSTRRPEARGGEMFWRMRRRRSFVARVVVVFIVIIIAALSMGPLTTECHLVGQQQKKSPGGGSSTNKLHTSDDFDPVEPEFEDSGAQVGAQASPLTGTNVECQPIQVDLCAKMPYKNTRIPNFFKDSNQIEVRLRALQYRDLVSSRCSAHLLNYLCELLAPVCIEEPEAMRRFDIYPCRSFCRRIKQDCEADLFQFSELLAKQTGDPSLLDGFNCDLLPFERNGGSGRFEGPCHDTPASPDPHEVLATREGYRQQQSANNKSSVYSPYQPTQDNIITDTSRIDPSVIRPPPMDIIDIATRNKQDPALRPAQQPSPWLTQIQSSAQTAFWALYRHSNVLFVITLVCLLIVLNSKRLRRLKSYLPFSPGSPKGSTSSGLHSHHLNHGGKIIPSGYPAIQSALSPSSSSRSLMLIAGSNKQPPSHQLVVSNDHHLHHQQLTDPSQKLLHGLQHQKTLINVNNGTLERQHGNRYLIMQPHGQQKQQQQHSDKQQLFSTLDSHSSHSNQYDYIQVTASDHHQSSGGATTDHSASNFSQFRQQQQQLYSNILLTSPSHQVLLMGQQNTARHGGYQQQQDAAAGTNSKGNTSGARQQFSSNGSSPPRSAPPQQPAPALGPRHAPFFSAASMTTPYAAPAECRGSILAGSLLGGDSPRSQRSFQRRSRKSSGGSGRFPAPAELHPELAAAAQLARTGAFNSSARRYNSASSASSSSSSAISPPSLAELTGAPPNPPLLGAAGRRM